jgi:hypothetical protein
MIKKQKQGKRKSPERMKKFSFDYLFREALLLCVG